MKKWIQKAIVQKVISYLPWSHQINYIFQKYVTKGVYLTDDYFYDRLVHAKEHLEAYSKYAHQPLPETTLEIGTGWYPVVPISFFLSGVKQIYSVDISFLTSKERVETTLLKFMECCNSGKLSNYINYSEPRLNALKELLKNYSQFTLEQILEQLNITYLIEDARQLSLPNQSIDLVNSNNTFEHIYPEILYPIMAEFKRVVKSNGEGVMSHSIDMSDHFAHFDKSISIYNFLRFSDAQWKWIDNSIQPQNRMRFYEYKKMYADLGVPITVETFRTGDTKQLERVQLSDKFVTQPVRETAISHCHFISDMRLT